MAKKKTKEVSEQPTSDARIVFKKLFIACREWLALVDPERIEDIDLPGRRIAILRVIRGISQTELANKAKVRQADVSHAENNFESVRLSALDNIAKILGVTFEDLRIQY